MKRFLPLFLMILTFTLFLGGQVAYKSIANLVKDFDVKRHSFNILEESFKKAVFKNIILHEEKTPIIILHFWAPWCSICLTEFPSLTKLHNNFPKEDLQIFSIYTNSNNDDYEARKILNKYKIDFPIIKDIDGELFDLFQINEIPTTIIFSSGKLLEFKQGPKDFSSERQIERFKHLIDQAK